MPARVPTYDNFQVAPTTLPNVQVNGAPSVEQASYTGRQMEEAGQKLVSGGSQLAKIQLDAQQQANQLRIADALNQAKEMEFKLRYDKDTGYEAVKGVDALQRPEGKPLADEYADKYKQSIESIASKLGNDEQRREFMLRANNSLVDFHGQAMAYEGAQFKEYALSVHEGTIKNSMNDIGLNYNNPDVVSKNIDSIKASAYEAAKMQGKSATWAEAQARQMTSAAHLTAVSAALQKNDPAFADDYLKKFAKDMTADDILKARGATTKELNNKLAMNTAATVVNKAVPRIVTSDSERAFNIAIGSESSGKQFGGPGSVAKPNEPTTSPKGAIGIAQVMPGTAPEAAKLAGLEWDEKRYREDPEYNRALGKAYFDKQLKDFNGNLPMAYAAYNAGPGALREAIEKAKTDGAYKEVTNPDGSVSGGRTGTGNWLAHLPKETQDYVEKNMKAFGNGSGQYAKPTLYELQQEVRKTVGSNNPEGLKLALDETERQYNDLMKSVKMQEEEAVATAMRAVQSNGGRFTDLPADIRGAIPAGEVTKVMDFASRISKGDDTTNLWLYNKLASNPSELQNLSDDQFFALRAELSAGDFKHFADTRAELLSGGTNSPGTLNTQMVKLVLDDRLRTMGIDPTPADASSEAQRVGAIRKFINDSILASQSVTGKKMNDAEVSQFVDSMFAKTSVYDGYIWNSNGPMLKMKAGDIPGDVKDKIKDAFKARGVEDPTDADILNVYWRQLTLKPTRRQTAGVY